jgi:hypothetical protein
MLMAWLFAVFIADTSWAAMLACDWLTVLQV